MHYDVISLLELHNFDRDQTTKRVSDIPCIAKQFIFTSTFITSASHLLSIRQPVTCKVHGASLSHRENEGLLKPDYGSIGT